MNEQYEYLGKISLKKEDGKLKVIIESGSADSSDTMKRESLHHMLYALQSFNNNNVIADMLEAKLRKVL